MTQVKVCDNEIEANLWLEEHQNEYAIRDIKPICSERSYSYKIMIIYETIPTIPEGIPFKWTDELKDAYDSVNGGLQIGG